MSSRSFIPMFQGCMTKTISITSGKGGVGKTSLLSNMAYFLGSKGYKVLILDGDMGVANVDLFFGVRPSSDLHCVFKGEKTLAEVVANVAPNVYLIPGGSGIYELSSINSFYRKSLLDQVSQLNGRFDFLLIDTAPGIAENVLYLNSAAQEIVVVLTPDPCSLADSYALVKVLHMKCRETNFSLVCNQVTGEKEALQLFDRFSDVVDQFLSVRLHYKGFVPQDQSLKMANRAQELVLKVNPGASSSEAIREVSKNICSFNDIGFDKGGMQFFWEQMVGVA